LAMCAGELGVRTIFGAGDEAFTREAAKLLPGIETVAVKRGLMSGRGDECTTKAYARRNVAAVHIHPQAATERIRPAAARALERMEAEEFGIVPLQPPFVREIWYRATEDNPPTYSRAEHPTHVAEAFNLPAEKLPVPPDKQLA